MAQIGSLTADLKLESAAFIRDMTKAAQATQRHTSAMQKSMAGLQKSFATVGSSLKTFVAGFISVAAVRQIAALGVSAIKTADQVAVAARKIGVSAEELQRFRHAAEQADVDVTELETAFRMFQRNLASGKIQAEGRSITEAFANFIKTVSEAPDQLEKTRLATAAAGRSSSAILALAAGNAKDFALELGNAFVVSEQLVRVGDQLDDEWARVVNAFSAGFDTGFLQAFSDGLGTTRGELEKLNEVARAFGGLVGSFASWTASIASGFVSLRETVFQAREEIQKLQAERAGKEFFPTPDRMAQANRPLPQFPSAATGGPLGEGINRDKEAAAAKRAFAEAARAANEELQKAEAIIAATRTPYEELAVQLREISRLYQENAITADTAARAQQAAILATAGTYIDAAAQITGTLAGAFQDNKAFAIANAVMNVAQGITQALTLPFPLNWAQVAAVTAAGIAQIANIRSARPGGGTTTKAASGGNGRAATEAAGVAGPQRSVFIKLEGSSNYTPEQMRNLIGQLVEAQKDGAKLILAQR